MASNMLGANLVKGDFKELELSPNKDLINFLCKVIADIDPDVVYTHYIGDQHLDHQAVARASLIAARNCRQVYAYISSMHDTIPVFNPDHFVNIDDYFEKKLALIDCFESEKETHPYWYQFLKDQASYNGLKAGCSYAEAFVLIRSVW